LAEAQLPPLCSRPIPSAFPRGLERPPAACLPLSQSLVTGPRPFPHRQRGPTRQPSPPSFFARWSRAGLNCAYQNPDSPGIWCIGSKPRPIKLGAHPRDPLLPSIAPQEALATLSIEFWISLASFRSSPRG